MKFMIIIFCAFLISCASLQELTQGSSPDLDFHSSSERMSASTADELEVDDSVPSARSSVYVPAASSWDQHIRAEEARTLKEASRYVAEAPLKPKKSVRVSSKTSKKKVLIAKSNLKKQKPASKLAKKSKVSSCQIAKNIKPQKRGLASTCQNVPTKKISGKSKRMAANGSRAIL